MREEIIARAPARVSFAGGGTDVPPFDAEYGGYVVSATIDQVFEARLRVRPDGYVLIRTNRRPNTMVWLDPEFGVFDGQLDFVKELASILHAPRGFELDLTAPLAHRTGLGGSAAMAVVVAGAFNQHATGRFYTDAELAEICWHVEHEVLGNASGRQDQYAAALGGMNQMWFRGGSNVEVKRLCCPPICRENLQASLALIRLDPRNGDSGEIVGEQARQSGNGRTRVALIETRKRAGAVAGALTMGDWKNLGRALDGLWLLKKEFHPGISNERIDALYDALKEVGVIGGKVTGAGGGGHMLICFDPTKRFLVIEAAKRLGVKFVPFCFHDSGLTITRRPLLGG